MTNDEKPKKKHDMSFDKIQPAKISWSRLTDEEKEEIVENAKKKKEEEQRKLNKKAADIMMGTQRTMDNAWE